MPLAYFPKVMFLCSASIGESGYGQPATVSKNVLSRAGRRVYLPERDSLSAETAEQSCTGIKTGDKRRLPVQKVGAITQNSGTRQESPNLVHRSACARGQPSWISSGNIATWDGSLDGRRRLRSRSFHAASFSLSHGTLTGQGHRRIVTHVV